MKRNEKHNNISLRERTISTQMHFKVGTWVRDIIYIVLITVNLFISHILNCVMLYNDTILIIFFVLYNIPLKGFERKLFFRKTNQLVYLI